MKSAETIRNCSMIMSGVFIAGAIAYGFVALFEVNFVVSLIIWAVGVFAGIMQNALFQGFADLIDNSYKIACKGNDAPETSVKENNSNCESETPVFVPNKLSSLTEEKTIKNNVESKTNEKRIECQDREMSTFFSTALNCNNFAEVKALWTSMDRSHIPNCDEITKNIESKSYVEKMYGGTNSIDVVEFVESLREQYGN